MFPDNLPRELVRARGYTDPSGDAFTPEEQLAYCQHIWEEHRSYEASFPFFRTPGKDPR